MTKRSDGGANWRGSGRRSSQGEKRQRPSAGATAGASAGKSQRPSTGSTARAAAGKTSDRSGRRAGSSGAAGRGTAGASGGAPSGNALPLRLALDRYLIGIWTRTELRQAAANPELPGLAALLEAPELDRPKRAERMREERFAAARPNELERFEALLREGVDRTAGGGSILPELQHDLLANTGSVPPGDTRAEAARVIAGLAAAMQVHGAVQVIGRLAEKTVDRVALARAEAVKELKRLLRDWPHLAP